MLVRYRIPVKEPTWIILAALHMETSVLIVAGRAMTQDACAGLANCRSQLSISVIACW